MDKNIYNMEPSSQISTRCVQLMKGKCHRIHVSFSLAGAFSFHITKDRGFFLFCLFALHCLLSMKNKVDG